MSILIKGMEMPKCCSKCDLRVISIGLIGLGFKCTISGETVDDYYSNRHPKCPLVEIPTPHGRLIDADRLLAVLKSMASTSANVPTEAVIGLIDNQPVIVEKERNE